MNKMLDPPDTPKSSTTSSATATIECSLDNSSRSINDRSSTSITITTGEWAVVDAPFSDVDDDVELGGGRGEEEEHSQENRASTTSHGEFGASETNSAVDDGVEVSSAVATTTDPNDTLPVPPPRSWLSSYMAPILIGLALLGVIIYVIIDFRTTGYVRTGLTAFLNWMRSNPAAGAFSFMGVYAVSTVFFIPGSLLTLGAGFVFSATFGLGLGIFVGILTVFVGACAGATMSFLLARYLFRKQAEKISHKYSIFQAVDAAIHKNGFKIFVLLRLSPLIPYTVFNYIGGVTSISLRAYAMALIGILPGTILYVFLGASAGSLADSAASGSDPTVTIIVLVLGLIPGVAAVYLTARYAKKELHRALEDGDEEEPDEVDGALVHEQQEEEEAQRINRSSQSEEDTEDKNVIERTEYLRTASESSLNLSSRSGESSTNPLGNAPL